MQPLIPALVLALLLQVPQSEPKIAVIMGPTAPVILMTEQEAKKQLKETKDEKLKSAIIIALGSSPALQREHLVCVAREALCHTIRGQRLPLQSSWF